MVGMAGRRFASIYHGSDGLLFDLSKGEVTYRGFVKADRINSKSVVVTVEHPVDVLRKAASELDDRWAAYVVPSWSSDHRYWEFVDAFRAAAKDLCGVEAQ